MYDERTAKKWKAAEVMLFQASEFLFNPNKFKLVSKSLNDYRENIRSDELEVAMLQLEKIARASGAKSVFWRRIKKVADQMDLHDKSEEYELAFHDALTQSKE